MSIRILGRRAFRAVGGVNLARHFLRERLRILMYHRFPSENSLVFEQHCQHLRKHYHPISLSETVSLLHAGEPLPPCALVVTVDDGYRDFLQVAWPLLVAYQIPVTVFVTTGFLDRHCWLWGDRVVYAFRHTNRPRASLRLPSGEEMAYSLNSLPDRIRAAGQIKKILKNLPDSIRRSWLEELPQALNIVLPVDSPAGYEPLQWEEMRVMMRENSLVEFGAHTATHPILSRIEDENELRKEVLESKHRIEKELNRPARHFCYPNGTWDDVNETAVREVRAAGFESAVMAVSGLNRTSSDLFRLRRLPIDSSLATAHFFEVDATGRS